VKNQEQECKAIQSLLETHKQEITIMKNETNTLGTKFEKLGAAID
jgi:hypothetical protein